MITIIKEGEIPTIIDVWEATCDECDTIFEFDDSAIIVRHISSPNDVICPVCGNTIMSVVWRNKTIKIEDYVKGIKIIEKGIRPIEILEFKIKCKNCKTIFKCLEGDFYSDNMINCPKCNEEIYRWSKMCDSTIVKIKQNKIKEGVK